MVSDMGFVASFEIMVKRSKNETPTPERLESLVVEAEDDDPHKTLATAFSVAVLEVVREGYGFPDGMVTTHTTRPHRMNVVDLQALNPSPDAPCTVEMFLMDTAKRSSFRVVARGDNPFTALNAAYERMISILGRRCSSGEITHIDERGDNQHAS